jgi:hypothetical protein
MDGCRRLPARFAAAVVAVTLCLLAAASIAEAAGNPVAITVQAGYHGIVKTGEWMPVIVDVTNSGPDIEGSLEVQAWSNGQNGPPAGNAVYQMPLSLTAGATKHFRTYVVEDYQGVTVTARIVQGGRVVATKDATNGSTSTALVGVVSDQPTALDNLAAVHPGGVGAGVAHLRPDEISDSALVLRAFDLLVIDDYATDTLTQRQRTAIADFVQGGGSLLVGTGSSWHKTLAGLPSSLLPMQVTGTAILASSQAIDGFTGAEVATGTVTSGHAWLSEGNLPLLVERAAGSGMVTMATFDWNQQPVLGAAGTESLLRQVLARAVFGSTAAQSYAGLGGSSIGQRGSGVVTALSNLPALDLPSLQLTGVLVLLYVLLVGPVNFFILRAMHRQALAWISVPLIAIVVAGGAYGGGILTKGRSVQTNQVELVRLHPGWDRAYLETYAGVMTPTRGDYQVRLGGDPVLISPVTTYYGGGFPGSNAGQDSITVDAERDAVGLPAMTAFTLRGFATEGVVTGPRLTGSVTLANGKLAGTVQNLSATSFTDGVVIAGDSYQLLGEIKPGATITINLTPKVSGGFGAPPVWSTIYTPNYQFGPPQNQPNAAQRDAQTKTQVLSLLPTGGGFKGVTSTIEPLFVGWTKQSFQNITVNGNLPRSTVLSAVALTLPIDQVGTGAVPPGVINGRVVDAEGAGVGQGGPVGMLMVTSGTVTYDFLPGLAAGTRMTGTTLNASNPIGKGLPPPGQGGPAAPTLQGEFWDWSQSAWVKVAYQDNGNTAVPDSAVAPSTGEVRLRITVSGSTAGGQPFMGGGVSLTGTVQ